MCPRSWPGIDSICTANTLTCLDASNLVRVRRWAAEQERGGMGGDPGSCRQQRQEATGGVLILGWAFRVPQLPWLVLISERSDRSITEFRPDVGTIFSVVGYNCHKSVIVFFFCFFFLLKLLHAHSIYRIPKWAAILRFCDSDFWDRSKLWFSFVLCCVAQLLHAALFGVFCFFFYF